ncbi:MAG TPA: hypothetical protein VM578_04595 [Candidatus Saccharimonadales bacterium]|nr:hypothetical protein [Candidatus Saccharimonadales bacterium]
MYRRFLALLTLILIFCGQALLQGGRSGGPLLYKYDGTIINHYSCKTNVSPGLSSRIGFHRPKSTILQPMNISG